MVTTTINGVEYPLATTLRVAYQVQGQHNHKPYSKVFADIGDMCIEDQIGILFCAFQVGNPDVQMLKQAFINYYLDNMNLKQIMDQLKAVIQEITGFEEPAESTQADAAKTEAASSEGN